MGSLLASARGQQTDPTKASEPPTGTAGKGEAGIPPQPAAAFASPLQFETPADPAPRFQVGDESALEHLRSRGYVVFASVLDEDEVDKARGLFWDWYEAATHGKVRRDNIKSWGSREWLGQASNGITGCGGVGQSAFMWFVRTRTRVMRAFADVWGLDDIGELLVSFDGCGAFRPPAENPAWRTRGGWFHCDQNGCSTGSNFVCAQGLVTLYDQDESTGGLALLPGSHQQHAELFQRWPTKRRHDFFVIPRGDPMLDGAGAIKPRLIHARAGDLIIWDSRTIHCNVPARHRFDEVPLAPELDARGLTDALPLCQEFPTVADAVWAYQAFVPRAGVEALAMLGVAPELCDAVGHYLADRAAELSSDLAAGCSQGPPRLLRLVAYVCALPRRGTSPAVLLAKRKAVLLGATTTHWPTRVLAGSVEPRRPGTVDPFTLPEIALRLVGCMGEDLAAMHEELREALQDLRERGEADVRGGLEANLCEDPSDSDNEEETKAPGGSDAVAGHEGSIEGREDREAQGPGEGLPQVQKRQRCGDA